MEPCLTSLLKFITASLGTAETSLSSLLAAVSRFASCALTSGSSLFSLLACESRPFSCARYAVSVLFSFLLCDARLFSCARYAWSSLVFFFACASRFLSWICTLGLSLLLFRAGVSLSTSCCFTSVLSLLFLRATVSLFCSLFLNFASCLLFLLFCLCFSRCIWDFAFWEFNFACWSLKYRSIRSVEDLSLTLSAEVSDVTDNVSHSGSGCWVDGIWNPINVCMSTVNCQYLFIMDGNITYHVQQITTVGVSKEMNEANLFSADKCVIACICPQISHNFFCYSVGRVWNLIPKLHEVCITREKMSNWHKVNKLFCRSTVCCDKYIMVWYESKPLSFISKLSCWWHWHVIYKTRQIWGI